MSEIAPTLLESGVVTRWRAAPAERLLAEFMLLEDEQREASCEPKLVRPLNAGQAWRTNEERSVGVASTG